MFHKSRGHGIVIEKLRRDGVHGHFADRFVVKFDNGESHKYSATSSAKLTVESGRAMRLAEGRRVTHPARGNGVIMKVDSHLWQKGHDAIDVCVDMFLDMGKNMRVNMCLDMCMNMCIGIFTDMCIEMCIDMCMDMCMGMIYKLDLYWAPMAGWAGCFGMG